MARGSAAEFLKLLNEQNDRIAARKAEEAKKQRTEVDPVRIQRDKERRERLGQLRAREHSSKRPIRAYGSVFGHINLEH